MTSTAVETTDKGPIDLAQVPESVKRMLQRLDVTASMGTVNAQLEIMAQILEAESEEDLFAAANAGTISGQKYVDRPFYLTGFEWKRSAPAYVQQGAFPFYALCRIQDVMTGETHVLDCGGFTFVSVLDGLDRKGYLEKAVKEGLPGYPMFLESRQMASGFAVLIPHRYVPQQPGKPAK